MQLVTTVLAHKSHINATLSAPLRGLLLSSGMDNLVKVWSMPDLDEVCCIAGHTASVNSVALNGTENLLATASSDGTIRLWTFPERRELHRYPVPSTSVSGVLAGPSGSVLAWTCSARQVLRLFDPATDATLLEVAGAPKRLSRVLFTPDGQQLLTVGLGSDVLLWNLATGQLAQTLAGHETAVMSALFAPDGSLLLTTGYERTLRLWDVATWKQVAQVDLGAAGQYPLAISADGRRLYLGIEHGVRRYSLPELTLIEEVTIPPKGVYSACLSAADHWLVVGAADKRLRLFDLTGDDHG